jgi:16S rRNA (adenine1518-N6/adenine1519-N6)-dimethyltransferase
LKAKKSYGQHFLNSESIAERIALSLQLGGEAYNKILEVGPGRGMLTKYLLQRPEQLIVVEADRDMVLYLHKHYPELKGHIVEGNFLRADLPALQQEDAFGLIGNFPYNISSQILFKMIDNRPYIPEMVGMFQKEVAERVVAGPGSKTYGVISVLVQAYYEGEYLFSVGKGSFTPPPKVEFAVIRLTRKADQDLGCNERTFRIVVKQAFSQRRKMLRNTMKSLLKGSPLLQEPLFSERPEQLGLDDFVKLSKWVEDWQNA